MDASKLLNNLIEMRNLSTEEIQLFLSEVIKGTIPPSQIGAILTALRMKGETADEILGFVRVMREYVIRLNSKDAIDVCGTGGDGSGTLNISTAVAIVAAGAGVKVAKHGNRAASSKCGSADVLEELGVHLPLSSQQAEEVLNKVGMTFLFAPLYHPAMKHVVTVRKELKIRTIFNFLGPFANPAAVTRQLVGVPNEEIAKKMATVGKALGYKHLLIVTSEDGLDEISISVNTVAYEVKNSLVKKFSINPKDYGYKNISQNEILGGDIKQNARLIREILEGVKNAKRDIVVFNSAYALYIAGKVNDIKEGIVLAEKSIDSKAAKLVLESLIQETQKYA